MPVRPVCVLELKPTILEQPVADKHSFKNESHREVDIVAVSLAAAIVMLLPILQLVTVLIWSATILQLLSRFS